MFACSLVNAPVVLQTYGAFLSNIGYLGILDYNPAVKHYCYLIACHSDIHRVPLTYGVIGRHFWYGCSAEFRCEFLVIPNRPELA